MGAPYSDQAEARAMFAQDLDVPTTKRRLDVNRRIDHAIEQAEQAFWERVADLFPEAQAGDFGPDQAATFDRAMREALEGWLRNNLPSSWKPVIPGFGDGLWYALSGGELFEFDPIAQGEPEDMLPAHPDREGTGWRRPQMLSDQHGVALIKALRELEAAR